MYRIFKFILTIKKTKFKFMVKIRTFIDILVMLNNSITVIIRNLIKICKLEKLKIKI